MKPSFCHLFRHFSVTMEPHCALNVAKHLFKNKRYYHHNANDRFGIIQTGGIQNLISMLQLPIPCIATAMPSLSARLRKRSNALAYLSLASE